MKAFSFILALGMMLFISACAVSPETLLPRKDGTWSYANVYKTTLGTLSDTKNTAGKAVFRKDGKGAMVATTTVDSTQFNWAYNENTKVITLTTTNLLINSTYTYTVSEVKLNSEKWTRNDTLTGGLIVEEIYTWTKAK